MPSSSLQQSVERTALAICEGLATPTSLGAWLRLKYGEFDDLAVKQVHPKHYLDAKSYARDVFATSFLRKYVELPTSFDREAVALDNFWLSEKQCFRTNERLHPYVEGWVSHPSATKGMQDFLSRVRKIVSCLLGPCPDLMDGRFGPGATFGDRGHLTTVPDKMSSRPTLTPSAIYFTFPWSGTAWAKACVADGRDLAFVRGNRFTTVPKDCTKDRGIAVEPSINLFYQLAYGGLMKKRLGRAGFDLLRAQDIHKRVACEASKEGHFATIDLSNASDTVCTNLVKLVLPSRWFDVMSDLRSSHTLVKGKWVKLEKFSSMGNGFTFELETTIFAAIVMACMEVKGLTPLPGDNVFVFGDDIICPTEVFSEVKIALQFFGFTPNEKKTFSEGMFRESCGGDYFDGVDVRPFFLKKEPNEPQEYIAMANGIARLGRQDPFDTDRPRHLRRAWFSVLDALPAHIRRLRGPSELGDLLVHDEDETKWQISVKHSIRYFRCYRPARFARVGWENWKPDVVLAAALYGVSDTLVGAPGKQISVGLTPRGSVLGYKVAWVPHS
jgi:hypothetical protein